MKRFASELHIKLAAGCEDLGDVTGTDRDYLLACWLEDLSRDEQEEIIVEALHDAADKSQRGENGSSPDPIHELIWNAPPIIQEALHSYVEKHNLLNRAWDRTLADIEAEKEEFRKNRAAA